MQKPVNSYVALNPDGYLVLYSVHLIRSAGCNKEVLQLFACPPDDAESCKMLCLVHYIAEVAPAAAADAAYMRC